MIDTREYYCKDEKTAREVCTIAELNGIKAYINGRFAKIECDIESGNIGAWFNCINRIGEYLLIGNKGKWNV